MKSSVVKHSIVVGGRETSVSLEDGFWNELKKIACMRQMTLSDLVAAIDSRRQHRNLSSVLRLFVLDFHCRPQQALAGINPPANFGRNDVKNFVASNERGRIRRKRDVRDPATVD
jgi:predicted DNA-binding ribbon-helix-helix protein